MEREGLHFQNNLPLYLRIANDLMEIISKAAPHTLLPSEPELVRKYGVSRGTVKQALDELEHQSFIYRRHGKGTFVAEPKILRHSHTVPSFSEDIRRRGHMPSIKLVSLSQEAPSHRVRTALSLSSTALVWRVKRIFLSDKVPLALVSSYLPVEEIESLTPMDVEYSLYAAMERRYNLRPTWASDSYSAVRATGEVVPLLSVKEGDPIIYSERVAYLRDMRVIEFVESFIRGDRFTVLVDWLPVNTDSEPTWSKLNGAEA
jgi:GntR family transcriptional regulator, N-acetylglucosamine utilization regulator